MIWIIIFAFLVRKRAPLFYQLVVWYVGLLFAAAIGAFGWEEGGVIGLLLVVALIYGFARFIKKDQHRSGRGWWEIGRY